MIQKCPKCGMWCAAFETDAAYRALDSAGKTVETFSKTGEKILGKPGKVLGQAFGFYSSLIGAGYGALLGDSYKFICPNCEYEWGTDDISTDAGNKLIAEVGDLASEVWKYKDSTQIEKENYINSLRLELNRISASIDERIFTYLYASLAFSYAFLLDDFSKAKSYIDQGLEIAPNNYSLMALKGVVFGEVRTASDYYKKLQQLIYYKKEDSDGLYFLTKELYQSHTEETITQYSEHFLEIPYIQRRFLVIDSKFDYLPDSFKVLPFNYLPTNIEFPAGHPNEQTLYICHPFRTNYYLPFDEFQIELFKDEINEFIEFVQALGANIIEVEEVRSSEKNDASKDSVGASIGGKYKKVAEGNIEGAYSNERAQFEDIKRKYKHIEKSSPVSIPCVPSGLVWYNHRPEWQRLERKRMNGTEEYEEIISTKQYTSGIQSNMQQLSVDFKALVASGNVKGKHEGEKEFSLGEEYELKIKVKFYPLSSYQNINKVNVPKLKKEEERKSLSRSPWIIGGIIALFVIIGIVLVLL